MGSVSVISQPAIFGCATERRVTNITAVELIVTWILLPHDLEFLSRAFFLRPDLGYLEEILNFVCLNTPYISAHNYHRCCIIVTVCHTVLFLNKINRNKSCSILLLCKVDDDETFSFTFWYSMDSLSWLAFEGAAVGVLLLLFLFSTTSPDLYCL